jgi:hypothetical protein
MTAFEFVKCFKQQKDELLTMYCGGSTQTAVGSMIESLGLTDEKKATMQRIVDTILTDAFYGILLGLDGAATLGAKQQGYSIRDAKGVLITAADDGELEGPAYELFHEDGESS